jgi:hypothetical protein
MDTNTTLISYIKTANGNLNKYALKLYIENKKENTFDSPEKPLWILKSIIDMIALHGSNIFSFVDEFEIFIAAQELTHPQRQLLYTTLNSYMRGATDKYKNSDYEYYYEDYLSYFISLNDGLKEQDTKAAIANSSIAEMINNILHRQMIKLSTELDTLPVAHKARIITALVKTLPTPAIKPNKAA